MLLCFLEQKTAYEMRISEWSSDVCSSDLWREDVHCRGDANQVQQPECGVNRIGQCRRQAVEQTTAFDADHQADLRSVSAGLPCATERSGVRRVGIECGSTCSSRGTRSHLPKK